MVEPDDQFDEALKAIYYDPVSSGSFGGLGRLMQEAKRQGLNVTRPTIERFLTDQQAYSLHKPVRRTFKRNRTFVSGIDKQWQADLADMQSIASTNDGYRYLLTCIDVFSKYAWVIPVKSKDAKAMGVAIQQLLDSAAPRKPQRIQTDKGKEFLCKPVQVLIKARGIQHFVSESDNKAAVVERFNRTLKTRIWTYFSAKRTTRYIDVLQDFTNSYNQSKHRSIGMKPADVRPEHEPTIWIRLYGDGSGGKRPQPLKANQKVRISRWKGDFEKGYMPNWSKEHYHVDSLVKHPRTVYNIRDETGDTLRGAFYREEVQPIRINKHYVERVLRHRTRAGVREVFVKWDGWSSNYNTWIKESELSSYQ